MREVNVRTMLMVLLLAGAGVSGCAQGVQDVGPAPTALPEPVGTYVLVSVDGSVLPYAVPAGERRPAALEITGARMVLGADGTFHQWMAYRFEAEGAQRTLERDFTGGWSRDGQAYRLTWDGAGVTPALLDGDTLTYDNMGMVLLFRRQR
jgi:hypothetical protein